MPKSKGLVSSNCEAIGAPTPKVSHATPHPSSHLEVACGSHEDNKQNCSKERDVFCQDEARAVGPPPKAVTVPQGPRRMAGKWREGRDGEDKDKAVMDDCHGWLQFCELPQLTDCYPHKVPVNGTPAFEEFTSKKIITNSNKMVQQWCGEQFDMRALYRQINSLVENNKIRDMPQIMYKQTLFLMKTVKNPI
ncbi:hypothetical protein EK904_014216 [Melospiza melodia maxima]|nr:hypothetical protein EK904_014216 [Melospiza melodia maxima]